ncbi:MAG: hypothetical protein HY080_04525 [Gammaproteobacteria bacterium]|nr:hypothetical protein [Gammaproteobacteria bacterium]
MYVAKRLILCIVAAAAVMSTAVYAAELTANASLTSNYVFRGFTQSDNGPALQGGIDYTPANGLYAGAWASTLDCPVNQYCFGSGNGKGGGLEVDLYGGYSLKLANNWGFDLGYIMYEYTDSNLDANREVYLGARYQGFSLTYYNGNDTTPGAGNYGYLDFKVKVELPEKFYLIGHYGMLNRKHGADINDISFGVARSFKEIWDTDLSLSVTSEDYTNKEKFFLTATKHFDLK